MKTKLEQLQGAFDEAISLRRQPHAEKAAEEMLETLASALGCEWGTYWEVDGEAMRLRAMATWSVPGLPAEKVDRLAMDTRSRSLSLSEGNAGLVWRSRKPLWTVDLVRGMCLPRSLEARELHLQGGIWFAIKTETTVYGVVELLGQEVPEPNDELLAGIELLGIRLGHAFEQRPS
jgi:GAF domain-containing protein